MTRRPAEGIRIGKGLFPTGDKSPKAGGLCACGCGRYATDRHHIVSRSYLSGPFDYVEIDGVPRPNICGLAAFPCHQDVTENRTSFLWDDGAWVLVDREGNWLPLGGDLGLEPSLPSAEITPERAPAGSLDDSEPDRDLLPEGPSDGVASTAEGAPGSVSSGEAVSASFPVSPGSTCPTCERRVPHPKKESSPKEVKQLNLGSAPVDYVEEIKGRLDEQAEAWGLTAEKNHRLKVLDLALEFSRAVTGDVARDVAKERPWAA